ncbi:MAG: DUF4349 domain-containing protein [Coriobacteriia bacterium]
MERRTRTQVTAGVLAALLLAGTLAGCTNGGEEAAYDEMNRTAGSAPAAVESEAVTEQYLSSEKALDTGAPSGTATDADRMIIRTQTLRLEVDDTPGAVEELRAIAKTNAAVITDMQVATETDGWLYRYDEYGYATGDGAALRGWVTVRVPAESLDAFVEAARALGTVKYQAEDTSDVTEQHVDLSARLTNLQAEEVRLRGFFDAATNVTEMLAVETELNRVRQEIESMQAQITYLERQAAMATVTIELTEKQPVVSPDGDDWGFRNAVTAGFRGAADVITFLIAFLIATAPLWIAALIVFFIVRAVLRRRRAKRAAAATQAVQVSPNDQTGV